MNGAPASRDALGAAIAKIVGLKREHDPILRRLASDAGMETATRELLIGHLVQEENEAVAALARIANTGAAAPAASADGAGPSPRTSVGSLRNAEPARTSVGSLRGAPG